MKIVFKTSIVLVTLIGSSLLYGSDDGKRSYDKPPQCPTYAQAVMGTTAKDLSRFADMDVKERDYLLEKQKAEEFYGFPIKGDGFKQIKSTQEQDQSSKLGGFFVNVLNYCFSPQSKKSQQGNKQTNAILNKIKDGDHAISYQKMIDKNYMPGVVVLTEEHLKSLESVQVDWQ